MTEMRSILKISKAICLSLLLVGVVGVFPAAAEDDSKDVDYNGNYEGRQVIPNSMAIFCKTNGETMVLEQMTKNERTEEEKKKSSALKKCLDQIVSEINNKEAISRAEGLKEYQIMLQEQRAQMLTEAAGKTAVMSTYSKDKQEAMAAVGEQQTVAEDQAGAANVEAKITDVIAGMRDLLAEEAKYLVLEGLIGVDPAVIVTEEEEKKDEEKASEEQTTTMQIVETHVEAEEEAPENAAAEANTSNDMDPNADADEGYAEDPNVSGNEQEGEQEVDKYVEEEVKGEYDPATGQCTVNGQTGPCKDGLYTSGDKKVICNDGGTCSDYVEW